MVACCWQVDIFSRGVWRHYPQSVQDSLEVCMLHARSWVGRALDADDPELAPASDARAQEGTRMYQISLLRSLVETNIPLTKYHTISTKMFLALYGT